MSSDAVPLNAPTPAARAAGAPVHTVAVVVPAHNEEDLLPSCLGALRTARRRCLKVHPQVRVLCLVVLDSCTDCSERAVQAWGFEGLPCSAGASGAARSAGYAHVLARLADVDPTQVWLASTDADTVVPPNWLADQVSIANGGVDTIIGTVEPDATMPQADRDEWFARHDFSEGHSHVFGANLGVRASAYVAAGGFEPIGLHEDVNLVRRLRALPDAKVLATDCVRVVTSSRLVGRAVGGFSGYLSNLRHEMSQAASGVMPVPGPSLIDVRGAAGVDGSDDPRIFPIGGGV